MVYGNPKGDASIRVAFDKVLRIVKAASDFCFERIRLSKILLHFDKNDMRS